MWCPLLIVLFVGIASAEHLGACKPVTEDHNDVDIKTTATLPSLDDENSDRCLLNIKAKGLDSSSNSSDADHYDEKCAFNVEETDVNLNFGNHTVKFAMSNSKFLVTLDGNIIRPLVERGISRYAPENDAEFEYTFWSLPGNSFFLYLLKNELRFYHDGEDHLKMASVRYRNMSPDLCDCFGWIVSPSVVQN